MRYLASALIGVLCLIAVVASIIAARHSPHDSRED